MRTTLIAAVALSAGLALVGPARAGIYSVSEGSPNPFAVPPAFPRFQEFLTAARSVPNLATEADPNSTRSKYLKRLAVLEAQGAAGKLTVDERIDMSYYY